MAKTNKAPTAKLRRHHFSISGPSQKIPPTRTTSKKKNLHSTASQKETQSFRTRCLLDDGTSSYADPLIDSMSFASHQQAIARPDASARPNLSKLFPIFSYFVMHDWVGKRWISSVRIMRLALPIVPARTPNPNSTLAVATIL
jgi:hypothetical protein